MQCGDVAKLSLTSLAWVIHYVICCDVIDISFQPSSPRTEATRLASLQQNVTAMVVGREAYRHVQMKHNSYIHIIGCV